MGNYVKMGKNKRTQVGNVKGVGSVKPKAHAAGSNNPRPSKKSGKPSKQVSQR